MKCDVIAAGIIEAAKDVNLSVPLVVRLAGTNVEKGKKRWRHRVFLSLQPMTWRKLHKK